MITLLLAAIDSFGSADFEYLYAGTFLLDAGFINGVYSWVMGKKG